MLKIDLHTHTNHVLKHVDSHIKPKELIDKAARLKFDVLAITEHTAYETLRGIKKVKNSMSTYHHFKDYARKKGIMLIQGAEALVEKKDILLINFEGDPEKYSTIGELEKLKNENVVIIAPHPYFPGRSSMGRKTEQNIKIIDALEHSHFYLKHINPNRKALEIAGKYGKTVIANSDAHFLSAFGRNYSLVEAEKNVDSVLEAVRKNRIRMVTEPWDMGRFSLLAGYQLYSNALKKLL